MKKLPLVAASLLALAASPASAEEKFRTMLNGYNENPSVSTPARGTFEASISRDGMIDYELSYRGLQGTVTQSHIHFAQELVLWPERGAGRTRLAKAYPVPERCRRRALRPGYGRFRSVARAALPSAADRGGVRAWGAACTRRWLGQVWHRRCSWTRCG